MVVDGETDFDDGRNGEMRFIILSNPYFSWDEINWTDG